MFPENLSDTKSEVGRSDAFFQRPMEVDADDFRNEEGHRLTEHPRFRFDAANTPANHTEAVDHGGVRVGADEGIRVVDAVFGKDTFGEIFEVHLVNDADAGRDHGESLESLLAPLEELVALAVADKFDRHVPVEGALGSGKIDLHRVIDDKIDRHKRLDLRGVSPPGDGGVTHCGDIDKQRNTGEVLKNDPRDGERDFVFAGSFRIPAGKVFDIVFADFAAVHIAEDRLEDDADADRETAQIRSDPGLGERRKGVKLTFGSGAGGEGS